MCKVVEDVKFQEVKDTIIGFCNDNNRIPNISDYNRYVKCGNKLINYFLLDNNITYSNLIENIIGLKQISINRKTEVYGIKELTNNYKIKVNGYISKYGKTPDFDTIKSFCKDIDEIRFIKLFGNSYTKFLKRIGIKPVRKMYDKMYSYKSYNKTLEDTMKNIIEKNNGADILIKTKSGITKISISD